MDSKNIIGLLLVINLFSGCVSGLMPKLANNSVPSWYLNTPQNNTQYLYGEGEGQTIKEAKENALNSMASKLIVSVQSSIQTTVKVSRDIKASTYSKDITNSVKVDVQKMKFTNVIVDKSIQKGDTFYMLVKVNRIQLFNLKKREFDINDKRITDKYNSLDKYTSLEKIRILEDMYPSIIKGKKQAVILNAINNAFNQSRYIAKYDKYIDEITRLKESSILYVTTNNPKRYFADQLIDALNQEQYKIGTKSKKDIEIKITNKVKYSKAMGWNIAKVSTTLSVIANNKIISNRIIATTGRSSTSKESALENASIQFIKNIKKETLDKVIFGK